MNPTIAARLCTARNLLVAVAGFGALGCTAPARFSPVNSDGRHFRSVDGRARLFRGVNARVSEIFDVTLDGGRAPLETVPPFEAADATRMAELGFNLLRLPLSWSGLEPTRGAFSEAYLDKVEQVVRLCGTEGISVLLDMHQDAWSKEIGEDGAPLWAIQPPPDQILAGPLNDLDKRRTSAQVTRAFAGFFTDDRNGLQGEFATMFTRLAARFVNDEAVLGYEIFNEPLAADSELLPFHTKVAAAIRTVDQKHLIAFEPSVTRNFTDAAPLADKPFADRGGIYAPHIYTAVFTNDGRLAADTYETALAASFAAARDEAVAWQLPLLVGEMGVDPSHAAWLGHALDAADEQLASTAMWVWKEESQGSWGLFDKLSDGSWAERPQMIAAASRPYPRLIGGDPEGVSWDGTRLVVRFVGRAGVPALHEVYFPGPDPVATCDGAMVPLVSMGRSVYQATCDNSGRHALVVH